MVPAACRRGPRRPGGCRGNARRGQAALVPAPAIVAVPSRCQPAGRPAAALPGREAERHPDRGRVRVVQPDQARGSQVSAAFLELGDHAHRERRSRADLLGPAVRALPVPAPGQDQPASHHRPHLRADFRLPGGSGSRGHPHEHVAAVGMQLVPVQMLGGEPACGLALQRRDQQPVALRGRGQPGQGQDIDVITVEGQGIRDTRQSFARARRAARHRPRASRAGLGTGETSTHDHSPPGSRMGPPPVTGQRRGRSPLHSARDVKSGHDPDTMPRRRGAAAPARPGRGSGGHPATTPRRRAGHYQAPGGAARAHTVPRGTHAAGQLEGAPGRAGMPATGRSVART